MLVWYLNLYLRGFKWYVHGLSTMGYYLQNSVHVLINEYLPGQGIMAHKDGPLYLNWVVILSLGSGADFEFLLHPGADPEQTLYLERRSVLIFSDELYTNWLHRVTHSNPLSNNPSRCLNERWITITTTQRLSTIDCSQS